MPELPELLTRVNKAKNPDALTDLEKKHLPVITAPDSVKAGEPFEVTLHVGKMLRHPNEPGHHIESVELYKGYVLLARVDLAGATTEPRVTLTVTLDPAIADDDAVLRAFDKCNVHGVWESTRPIQVA